MDDPFAASLQQRAVPQGANVVDPRYYPADEAKSREYLDKERSYRIASNWECLCRAATIRADDGLMEELRAWASAHRRDFDRESKIVGI